MNQQKRADLQMGHQSENDIHEYLESFFGKLNNTRDCKEYGKYYEFDKFNDNCYIEIKTRNIKHNQYNSLMFGLNKLEKGRELKKLDPSLRIIYIWRCYDGIYYWEQDTSPYKIQFSGRTDRGKDERSNLVHIATENIKNLCDFCSLENDNQDAKTD